MKLIGGSFGIEGSANIGKEGTLFLYGARNASYTAQEVKSVIGSVSKARKFGAGGFILGLAIFGFIGFFIAGLIGLAIAIAICVAGSFYSSETNIADVTFCGRGDGQGLGQRQGNPRPDSLPQTSLDRLYAYTVRFGLRMCVISVPRH